MNRDWLALRPLIVVGATFTIVLGALFGVAELGRAGAIIAPPEQVGEQVVRGIEGGNYASAFDKLSPAGQETTSPDELRRLAARIVALHGGIEDASGEGAWTNGQTGIAVVLVKLVDGSEQKIELPLVQEQHTWQVDSIEPLRKLAEH